jgi:hypothetical protein
MKIDFTITQNGYTYSDAIFVENETSEQIEAMKQARFDNWYKIITTPVDPNYVDETPTEETE